MAQSQNFHQVKDINPLRSSDPKNIGAFTRQYAVTGNMAYFSANDGIHGFELWKSDGTAAGTALVKDVRPGVSGGVGVGITPFGSKVLFEGNDSTHGYEPWISDGTDTGTHLIKDFVPGTGSSYPLNFIPVGDKAFIVLNTDNYTPNQIWVTDGTEAGTSLVYDLGAQPPSGTGIGNSFISFQNKLFFTNRTPATGGELWQSDGTAAGTFLVKDIEPGTASGSPNNFVILNDKLYFSVTPGFTNTTTLWETDGTPDGTRQAAPNEFRLSYSFSSLFVVYNGALYFPADEGTGTELYKYDPQARYISLVKDIVPGTTGSNVSALTATPSRLYFEANDAGGYPHLWTSDGTTAGTTSIYNLDSLQNLNFIAQPFGDKLVFITDDAQYGREPWISDGTTAGTALLKDINPGIYSSTFFYMSPMQDKLLFNANDGITGMELWSSDGTTAGTQQLVNINTTAGDNSQLYLSGSTHAVINGKMVFSDYDGNSGVEPWVTDGTEAGTSLLKDIEPGYGSSSFNPHYTSFNNKVYFYVYKGSSFLKLDVWSTDGTTAGTRLFQPLDTAQVSYIYPYEMAATNSNLFAFCNSNGADIVVLRVSDGVQPFHTLKSHIYRFDNYYPVSIGNELFFVATDDNVYGSDELWKSDGTEAGTVRVKDIRPGTAGSFPSNLAVFNGKVYFRATDSGNYYYLYASDGTEAGTQPVTGIPISSTPFVASGGYLYFVEDGGGTLWRTKGTPGDATPVGIFNQGIISHLIDVNGVLCFQLDDTHNNISLWKITATETNISGVAFLNTGEVINEMANVNGTLYFTVNNKTLWQTNAGFTGAFPVADAGLQDAYFISQLTAVGNLLYFGGSTQQYGYELYVGTASSVLPLRLLSFDARLQNGNVLTRWKTANEISVAGFEVQRSLDGVGFITLGKVKAHGEGGSYDYAFTDSSVSGITQKVIYYRLQQTAPDGKMVTSQVVSVQLPQARMVSIYPNPARQSTTVYAGADMPGAGILVYDATGKLVYEAKKDMIKGAGCTLNTGALPAGIYTVRITAPGNRTYSEKLVVIK